MAQGDIYQVKDFQVMYGQEILNVYFYRDIDGLQDWELVSQGFVGEVLSNVKDIQHPSVTHTRLEVENLFDPTDFGTSSPNIAGTLAGAVMAEFIAASYRFDRQRRDMRHGYKRVVGMTEELVSGTSFDQGNVNFPKFSALLSHFKNNLSNSGVTGVNCEPVVIARVPYVTSGGKQSYRLPLSQSELTYYPITSVTLLGVTTQNTRKG